jgi:hypothetical protein
VGVFAQALAGCHWALGCALGCALGGAVWRALSAGAHEGIGMRDGKVGLVIEKVFSKRGTFENQKKTLAGKKRADEIFFFASHFFFGQTFFPFLRVPPFQKKNFFLSA